MFTTISGGPTKSGVEKIGGDCPQMPHAAMGLSYCRNSSFLIFLIPNNTYIIGLYSFMHISRTFAETEPVKAALQ